MNVIGIDVGTTNVKLVVYNDSGATLDALNEPLPLLSSSSDTSEVDMEETWQVVLRLLRRATRDIVDGASVAGIGVTAAGAGLWPTTATGEPVGPAVLWNDGRAADLMVSWQQQGRIPDIFQLSRNVAMPGYPLPMLAWLDEHDPQRRAQIGRVQFAKDWIGFRLTGSWVTDPSDASYGLFDQQARTWDPAIAHAVGLDGAYDLFPTIMDATAVRGTVTAELRVDLGLGDECVVSVGLVDVAATVLGAGASKPGDACSILGTSAINCVVTTGPDTPPDNVGQTLATTDGLWVRALVNTSGTQCVDWAAHVLAGEGEPLSAADVERLAASSVDGANGVLFHPYVSLAGVIAPFVHPGARGNFAGMTAATTRADLARAVYEGVALAIADCYGAIDAPLEAVFLAGGGARSTLWRELVADLLQVPVHVPTDPELGARGAAMTACVAARLHPSLYETQQAWALSTDTTRPDPGRSTVTRGRLGLFRQVAEALQQLWTSLLSERAS